MFALLRQGFDRPADAFTMLASSRRANEVTASTTRTFLDASEDVANLRAEAINLAVRRRTSRTKAC